MEPGRLKIDLSMSRRAGYETVQAGYDLGLMSAAMSAARSAGMLAAMPA